MRPTNVPPGSSSRDGGSGAGDRRIDSTESAVAAVMEMADSYGRETTVEHSIGADQSARRLASGAFTVVDPDGSLPHEAYIEIAGRPTVCMEIFSEGDASITVDTVEFIGVPREQLPAFLDAVYGGRAWVRGRRFPPTLHLIVPIPGDVTYKEPILGPWNMTPWLNGLIR